MLEGNADVAIKYLGLISAGRVQIASDGVQVEEASEVLLPELAEGSEGDTE